MHRSRMIILLLAACPPLLCAAARADMGVLRLTDGTVMRGDLTRTQTEVILRNVLGETRVPLDRVARIDWIASEPAASEPTSQPAAEPETARAGGAMVPAAEPELLSPADVHRIELSELPLTGEPERVVVHFLGQADEPSVPDLVRDELAARDEVDPTWNSILTRGKPNEKLQVVLAATGLRYADRIELRGETDMFMDFRRRVLPLMLKGCARAGCHTGPDAAAPRFPTGLRNDEAYVATMFHLLDTTVAQQGPLINRDAAEDSVFVQYLLPASDDVAQHPAVPRAKLMPVLRGTQDRRYIELIEWIRRLRNPHPDYQLSQGATASQPATSQPAAAPRPEARAK